MNIVADSNIPEVERAFAHIGNVRLVEGRALTSPDIADADILLVRSVTQVDAPLLEGTPVAFVGSATSGYEHIDTHYLKAAGIGFAHAPGSNARSVVEYVLAAIAQTASHLEALLQGANMGIVGYGHVGKALAALCEALGVGYSIYDPWLEGVPNSMALAQVLQSGVVSLHSELTLEQPWPSHHLLDAHALAHIQPGALLINASRGSVIDNAALLQRLKRNPDFDVVLDVWEAEPVINPALLSAVTMGTPHIAGYSHDGKLAATARLAAAATAYFKRSSSAVEKPSAPADMINVIGTADAVDALRAMIGARYRIAQDDQRLRAAVRGLDAAKASRAFDHLRKTYPVRRELWGSIVRYEGTDEAVLRAIGAVGCKLREARTE